MPYCVQDTLPAHVDRPTAVGHLYKVLEDVATTAVETKVTEQCLQGGCQKVEEIKLELSIYFVQFGEILSGEVNPTNCRYWTKEGGQILMCVLHHSTDQNFL